jgi:hypothetical protein
VAVVVVPLSLIGALLGRRSQGTRRSWRADDQCDRSFGAFVLGAIVAAIIGINHLRDPPGGDAAGGRPSPRSAIPSTSSESYRWGLKRFGSVLLVAFLVGITVAVGFILLIIPGIIFLTLLSVSIPAVVIENRRGTDAMKRSWNLAKENFWHVLGVIIVAAIITGDRGQHPELGWAETTGWQRWIFSAIAQILTAPFSPRW